jgi:hypothetical protein
MICLNQEAANPFMDFVCEAFTDYGNPNPQLLAYMKECLQKYQILMGANFAQFLNSLEESMKNKLVIRFDL